ncbi:MAG: hypothetical protein ACOX6I_05395 [Syntrophomonadaceae bacterium]|jgi:hypothetical protein
MPAVRNYRIAGIFIVISIALSLITWPAIPVQARSELSLGSVGENYDPDTPLIIYAQCQAHDNLRVKFVGDKTRYASDVEISDRHGDLFFDQEGHQYILVYLPLRSRRLEPGLYSVMVINTDTNKEIVKGQFSVIAAAAQPKPEEGTNFGYDGRLGEVRSNTETSTSTLVLSQKYTDRTYLEINLDDLMGEDVRERIIKFKGDRNDHLGELRTLSKWADITLYGVRLDSRNSNNQVELRLGRIPPVQAYALKSKLVHENLKSDFIAVEGVNFQTDRVEVQIPYRQSEGSNLKVLRYDQTLRKWLPQVFSVDRINQRVLVYNTQPGIFIVVEK